MKRKSYIKPPREAKNHQNEIWKLKNCVYGLPGTSMMRFKTVKTFPMENEVKSFEKDLLFQNCVEHFLSKKRTIVVLDTGPEYYIHKRAAYQNDYISQLTKLK